MLVLGPNKQRDLLLDLTINLDGCTVVSNKPLTNISRIFQGQLFSIAKIGNFLSKNDAEKLILAFVTFRVDYCNALLSGYTRLLES